MVEFLKGFLIYVIIWWIVGIKKPDKVEKGHADGAPKNPLIIKKFLITSLTAFILWLIVFYMIKNQYFVYDYTN